MYDKEEESNHREGVAKAVCYLGGSFMHASPAWIDVNRVCSARGESSVMSNR